MRRKIEIGDAGQESTNFVDLLKFIRIVARNPKKIGSVAPSGRQLARKMAQQIRLNLDGPIVELGPGNGAVTKEILKAGVEPERLTVVEYDDKFCEIIREKFVKVNVINGDAFTLKNTLAESNISSVAAIVSSLPLLNFNMESRKRLLQEGLDLLMPNAPFIQFSYGLFSPISIESVEISVAKSNWIVMNVPPARVWTYCRPGN